MNKLNIINDDEFELYLYITTGISPFEANKITNLGVFETYLLLHCRDTANKYGYIPLGNINHFIENI